MRGRMSMGRTMIYLGTSLTVICAALAWIGGPPAGPVWGTVGVAIGLASLAAVIQQLRRPRQAWTTDDTLDLGGYPLDMLRDGRFLSSRRRVA